MGGQVGGWVVKRVGGSSGCVGQVGVWHKCVCGQGVWPKCVYVCVGVKWVGGRVGGWSSG